MVQSRQAFNGKNSFVVLLICQSQNGVWVSNGAVLCCVRLCRGVRTIKRAGKCEEYSGAIIIRIIVPVSHQVSISYDVHIHHIKCMLYVRKYAICCDVAVVVSLRPQRCEVVLDI